MSRILLAVDLSYQTYRAAASHPLLTSGRHFTGGLYGFYSTLAKMIRETQATEVCFCQDSKPYLRSRDYPEYKQLRKAHANEELLKMYKSSMVLVLKTLEEMGFATWGIAGFESDDLIAHAAIKYRHRYDRIYAGSNDSDLNQLLWIPNFTIYRKSISDIMTAAWLTKTMGITPEQHMLMTAMTGTHNDIAGIPRVGDTTALKIMADPAKMRKAWADHGDVIKRNLELIKLPHREFPKEATVPRHHGAFSHRDAYRSLSRYEIEVTGAMINSLEQVRGK